VLALPEAAAAANPQASPARTGQALSLGELLRRAVEGGAA
jgi:hypothetical protein